MAEITKSTLLQYKCKLTTPEVVKIVHQMKHEMNMMKGNEETNNESNFKHLFKDFCPDLKLKTKDNETYEITIEENKIDLVYRKSNVISGDWEFPVWRVFIQSKLDGSCSCRVECFNPDNMYKFIPYLKTKANNFIFG